MAGNQKPPLRTATEEMLDRAQRKALGVRNAQANDADTVYGDTSRGERTGVRFMGIDALESDQGEEGKRAAEWMKAQTDGQDLGAEGAGVDGHGRRIQMVYTKDGKPLNIEAVRQGHAIAYRDYFDQVSPQMQQLILQAESEAKAAKRGYWGNPNLEEPAKFRLRKDIEAYKSGKRDKNGKLPKDPFKPFGEEKYQVPETGLAQAVEPFDRLRNAVASTAHGALKAPWGHKLEMAARSGFQGLKGERQTTGTMLKDRVTGELGLGKVRAGYDDGEFQGGDVGDHGLDFLIDIGTDPLTYLSGGLSAVAKLGAAGKVAPKLTAGLRELRAARAGAGEMTDGAKAAQKFVDRSRVAMGAGIGAGTQGGEDSGDDALIAALLGGAAVAGGIRLSRAAGPKVQAKYDDWYDAYAKKTGKVGTVDDEIKALVREAKVDDGKELRKRVNKEVQDEFEASGRGFNRDDPPEVLRQKQLDLMKAQQAAHDAEIGKVNTALRAEAKKQLDYSKKKFATPEEYEEALVDKAKLIQDVVVADGSISKAMRAARKGLHRIRYIASEMTQGRYEILDKLDEAERPFFKDAMRMGKEETKRFREQTYKSRDFDPDLMMGPALRERIVKGELTDWEREALNKDFQAEFARQREELHAGLGQAQTSLERAKIQQEMSKMVDRQIRFERELENGFVHPYSVNKAYAMLGRRAEETVNEVTILANKRADAYMGRMLPKFASDNVREAVNSWVNANQEFMNRYNQDVLGVPVGPKQTGSAQRGVVGLNWHVEDVYSDKDLLETDQIFSVVRDSKLKAARAEGSSQVGLEIGEDNQYATYAKGMAYKFIDKQTKEAMRMVRGYHEMLAKQGHVRGFEKILGMFDKMQNFAKANMLYFSTSWMKNNYFDNLAKAWIEGGYGNLKEVAATGKGVFKKLRSDLAHDLADIAVGKASRKFNDDEILEAMRLGVLDALAFDTLLNQDELRMALKDTKSYKQFIAGAPEDPKGFVGQFADWWVGNLSKTVGTMGNYIESAARMVTYKNVREQMVALGHTEVAAKEIAAKMVKETFFDYGDVTAFEQAVFKRIVPFYGFYSKNLPYWAKAVTSPQKAARIAGVEHVRQNVGEDLRPGEADGLQPYLRENNPRKLGKDKMGNIIFAITPSGSMDDAIKMMNPKAWKDIAIEKSSPLLKLPLELATGHDTFNDSPLLPSDNKKGQKFLYSRGFKLVAVQKLLEKAGLKPDSLGIHVDERGNPYATSDAVAAADKILSTLYPQGALEQLAGSIGKVGHEKESVIQAMINRMSPIQQVKVTPQSMRATKLKREKERGE